MIGIYLMQILTQRPVQYRAHPFELSVGEIVAELFWIDDATDWKGMIGDWARARAGILRAEMLRREGLS